MNHTTISPGPGYYNIRKDFGKLYKHPTRVKCFIDSGDNCTLCEVLQLGDYYLRNKTVWCRNCFLKLKAKDIFLNAEKVRHCSFYHHHIGVASIVFHKIDMKGIRRLEQLEKSMFQKYGKFYT